MGDTERKREREMNGKEAHDKPRFDDSFYENDPLTPKSVRAKVMKDNYLT